MLGAQDLPQGALLSAGVGEVYAPGRAARCARAPEPEPRRSTRSWSPDRRATGLVFDDVAWLAAAQGIARLGQRLLERRLGGRGLVARLLGGRVLGGRLLERRLLERRVLVGRLLERRLLADSLRRRPTS